MSAAGTLTHEPEETPMATAPFHRRQYREKLCEWLRANGIDPDRILQGSPLEFNADETELRYEAIVLDEQGQPGRDGLGRLICEERVTTIVVPCPKELRA